MRVKEGDPSSLSDTLLRVTPHRHSECAYFTVVLMNIRIYLLPFCRVYVLLKFIMKKKKKRGDPSGAKYRYAPSGKR